jgi:tRNA U34 2-thiouridine synthase MnmA/TrmU
VLVREAWLEEGTARVHAKLRGRSPVVAARVERAREGLRLQLDEPVYGVAAGQTAALYDDHGCIIGAGVIALGETPS